MSEEKSNNPPDFSHNSSLIRLIYRFPKGSIWQTRFICLPAAIIASTIAFARLDLPASFNFISVKTGLYLAGALTWTLLEYLLHRFVLHFEGHSAVAKAILNRLHVFHHDDPKDQSQVCIPPALLGFFSLMIFFGLTFVVGLSTAPCAFFLFGLITMMVVYDLTHFSTHYMPATNPLLQRLKKRHLLHHFSDHTRHFGVTSPFWDYVFRTN